MKYWYYYGGEDEKHCQVWYIAQQESQSNLLKKLLLMMLGMLMVMRMVVMTMMMTNHGHSSDCESKPPRSLAVILSIDRSNLPQTPPTIPQLNIMRPNNLRGPQHCHYMVGATNLQRSSLTLLHLNLFHFHFLNEVNHCVAQLVCLIVRGTFLFIWVNEFVSCLGRSILTTSMSWQKWCLLPLHFIRLIFVIIWTVGQVIVQLVDLYFLLLLSHPGFSITRCETHSSNVVRAE